MVLAVLVLASISFGQEEILQYYENGGEIFQGVYLEYRGVWYDVTQFDVNAIGFQITEVEYWFYEDPNCPWIDTTFDSEIYDADMSSYEPGDPENPPAVVNPWLARENGIAAQHYSPSYHTFSPPLIVDTDFWCFAHRVSPNDGPECAFEIVEPQFPHSFKGNTFSSLTVLDWNPEGYGEFWFRVHGEFIYPAEMTSTTWGSIKALF